MKKGATTSVHWIVNALFWMSFTACATTAATSGADVWAYAGFAITLASALIAHQYVFFTTLDAGGQVMILVNGSIRRAKN